MTNEALRVVGVIERDLQNFSDAQKLRGLSTEERTPETPTSSVRPTKYDPVWPTVSLPVPPKQELSPPKLVLRTETVVPVPKVDSPVVTVPVVAASNAKTEVPAFAQLIERSIVGWTLLAIGYWLGKHGFLDNLLPF